MKKTYLLILTLIISININAQSYIGFLTDNYSGVHGVISNPANIADSKYKLDINLVGASGLFGNDYLGFQVTELLNADYSLSNDPTRFPESENSLFGNVDILGPSALININKKTAVAIFTRFRSFYNVNKLDGNDLGKIIDGFNQDEAFEANINQGNISTNSWAEIGFTYSSVLINENQHFAKGGFTFKYLKGLGNAYSTLSDVSLSYDPLNSVPGSSSEGSVTANGDFVYGYSENFRNNTDDIGSVAGANALGLDFGLIYEWRPNELTRNYTGVNKYKLKLGLSVTDIGSITYDNIEETYNVNNTSISSSNFEAIRSAEDIRTFYSIQSTAQTEKAVLPTTFHLNTDWNINQKYYLNFNADLSLTSKDKINRSHAVNMFTLTPRFESKIFTVQAPISVQQYTGVQLGAGFRAGPIYIGSGSAISSLFKKDAKSLDVYAGIKIPFFKPKSKDKDEDGVPDKIDRCKDVAGDKDNNGCPWEDTDGDGLTDNLDDCPEIPGDASNNGCPKETFEIQKVLDESARTILFISNGKEISTESEAALSEVIKILNDNETVRLSIEGHADSIGLSSSNQRLSETRANTVRNYLIGKGIDPNRLDAVGYGENKPIATNLTRKGRAANRRVEIKIIQSEF